MLEFKDDKETYGVFRFPWNGWKKKHDLPKLARHADIGLTEKEIKSLDWCTDFITWKYRYPLPLNTLRQISGAVAYHSAYGMRSKLRKFFAIGRELSYEFEKSMWIELEEWLKYLCQKTESKI